jgi:hypothetical protein
LSIAGWVLWAFVTLLVGSCALVWFNDGFGIGRDYLQCFLWGIGIREWVESDNQALKKKFAPNVLRQLHAKRLGVKPQDLPENADYQAHSMGLHVTPFREIPPFGSREMIVDPSDPFAVDACFWEIFRHARSLFSRLWELLEGKQPNPEKNTRLRRFVVAHESVERSSELYYGILEAACERNAELPSGPVSVAPNIDDRSVLVHGSPQVMLDSIHLEEHFIHVPFHSDPSSFGSQLGGVEGAEFVAPFTDCFIGHLDASFRHHLLNVAIAYGKAEVQPYALLHHFDRKTMPTVPSLRLTHHVSISHL